jgi:uncharacterized membrane protein
VSKPRTSPAFLAYLLSIFGWLYVFLFRREDEFAVYHAKQSMVLTIAAIGAPVVWAVAAWVVAWIPLIGPVIAAALFALVLLAYVALGAIWIVGMVNALQAKMKPVPIVGTWARRIP